jgi:hypothetical protein
MSVQDAIHTADALLSGNAQENDNDRWQAIIAVGKYIESEPEPIWEFVRRWGNHPLEDLRVVIATVLLEHLLEFHFELIFPRIEGVAQDDPLFADMFCRCWKFGQSEQPANAQRFDALQNHCAGFVSKLACQTHARRDSN